MNRKKRRFNLTAFLGTLFAITAVLYFAFSIGVRSYNSYLNVVKQEYENKIATLSKDNETAQMEVNQLSTYDRISNIASNDGMSLNNEVITVGANE